MWTTAEGGANLADGFPASGVVWCVGVSNAKGPLTRSKQHIQVANVQVLI